MTAITSVANLAPLDYRYALDAATSALAGKTPLVVSCRAIELLPEVHQRIPVALEAGSAAGGLWVEPQIDDWQIELAAFESGLARGGTLAIVASRPLARLLPERRAWDGRPLGLRYGGLGRLRRALERSGFRVEEYGIHSALAVLISLMSQRCERVGRPDLGDRLHFAARRRYCATGPLAALSTVALLIAGREGRRC